MRSHFWVIVVALVAACTSAGRPRQTPDTTTTVASTTSVTLSGEEAAAEFAACLEERGVVVPDLPTDEGSGAGRPRPDLGGLATSNDPASAGFRAALNDCAPLLVSNGVLLLAGYPELAAAVKHQLGLFSECMRDQGVEEFPDPDSAFDGTGPPFLAAAVPLADPDLAAAIDYCSTRLGLAPLTG